MFRQLVLPLVCLTAKAASQTVPMRVETVAGWRVADGDMALGRAGEQRQAAFGAKLWPGGRIPYEIAPGFRSRDCLDGAIREWNTRTVVRLAPRAGEADYLVFTPATRSFTMVGLVGGPQPVFLEEGECGLGLNRTGVHEIGHAVGLFHEHQRSDRDRFIRVQPENSTLPPQDLVTTLGSPSGPYDYASAMHYGPLGGGGSGAVIETIPRGIPTGLDLGTGPMLSAGDIDAVQRIYGEPPRLTTITTNPAGLEVTVDGQRRATPFTVDWAAGTQHTIDVPSPQTREGARHEFGRWNDEGRQAHTITAGTVTHLAANFIAYVRIRGVSNEAARGSVAVDSPDGTAGPADGLRLIGSPVRVRAQAAPGFFLRLWESGRGSRNPLVFPVFHPDPAFNDFVARFEPYPVTTVASQPPGLRVTVNGVEGLTPAQYRWEPATVQTIDFVREVVTGAARHRLDVIRTEAPVQSPGRIIATPFDANIVAVYRTDYPVRATASPPGAGQVTLTPGPADGYALPGERLQLRAVAAANFRFLRWRGAGESETNPLSVTVQGAVEVVAEFISTAQGVNEPVVRSAASALGGAVAPGQIVSIFLGGLPELAYGEFTAGKLATEVSGVTVLVNGGIAAPIVAVAPGQVNAIMPYALTPGAANVRLAVTRDGRVLGETTVTVTETAPALFTANASGSGQAAALNQDGSYNNAERPAAAGEIVVLFGTGEGALEPGAADGSIAVAPVAKPRLPLTLEIGGRAARILYAGPAPGSVYGLWQINAVMPAGLEPGAAGVVALAGAARSAPGVTIAVK